MHMDRASVCGAAADGRRAPRTAARAAQITILIALLLAIIYIIDTVAKERDLLEAPQARARVAPRKS